MNIYIENMKMPIDENDFIIVCENFRKRIIRILFLRDDMNTGMINEYDIKSYVNALIWDIYGAYVVFNECRFLNCICELEGIKEHIHEDFMRKKTLDLASFVSSISSK